MVGLQEQGKEREKGWFYSLMGFLWGVWGGAHWGFFLFCLFDGEVA